MSDEITELLELLRGKKKTPMVDNPFLQDRGFSDEKEVQTRFEEDEVSDAVERLKKKEEMKSLLLELLSGKE